MLARESQVLKDFHSTTRCLDSYLNGARRPREEPAASPYGPPDSRSYKSNAQIAAASDTFRKQSDGDQPPDDQTIDAARELLDDLQTIAKANVDQLQSRQSRHGLTGTGGKT